MATREEWIYPITWCVVCKAGFSTVEHLIDHQLKARHWRPIPPPAGRGDPAGATQLLQAVQAAEAWRRTSVEHPHKSDTMSQEDGDGEPLSV